MRRARASRAMVDFWAGKLVRDSCEIVFQLVTSEENYYFSLIFVTVLRVNLFLGLFLNVW